MNEIRKVVAGLPEKAREIIARKTGRDAVLEQVCRLLHDEVPAYDWVGFYLPDPDGRRELVLGPYVGEPTEHIRIPFGRGICGQSADTLKTVLVEDVTSESNYLACSPSVRSEIVVPVLKEGDFVAELDIDSHRYAGIGATDRKILEQICADLSDLF